MSFLFKKPAAPAPVYLSAPAPAAVPVSPVPAASAAAAAASAAPATAADAQAARDADSKANIADATQNGRSSTIVAGMQIASDQQQTRGLLSQKKRQAAMELG